MISGSRRRQEPPRIRELVGHRVSAVGGADAGGVLAATGDGLLGNGLGPASQGSRGCRATPSRPKILVEVDHPEVSPDGRPVERVWTVRLRRGRRVVVIADDLGWPSANALAGALDDLLRPSARQKGGTIE